jgi:peptidoglycan/LPS O-acetylase OafA/YrhL
MSAQDRRFDLNWLRGAAALSVALLHCREVTWVGLRQFHAQDTGGHFLDLVLAYLCSPVVWGSAGVAVFFVISGYVIHASPARKLARDPAWRLDTRTFYLRRFVRIYAVLLLALVLTYLLDSVSRQFAPALPNLRDISPIAFFANLLALQGSVVPDFGSNGPLWTLAIEIHFYAAYPLLLIARRHLSPGALLGGSAALAAVSYAILGPHNIEFFTTYYVCWLLGFYAAELQAAGRRPLGVAGLGIAAACFAILGCGVFFVSQVGAFVLWSIATFFYLLRVFEMPAKTGRVIRALSGVGVFSYTLYAVHEPIAVFLVSVSNHGEKSMSMLVPLVALVIVVMASYLLYLIAEKPSIAWLEKHASERPRIPASAPRDRLRELGHRLAEPDSTAGLPRRVERERSVGEKEHHGRAEKESAHLLTEF